MSHTINSSQTTHSRQSARLFPFTEAEERAMKRAIKRSVKFMATFGKGRDPYMVDLRYYNN